jgi:hypothetical protein
MLLVVDSFIRFLPSFWRGFAREILGVFGFSLIFGGFKFLGGIFEMAVWSKF